jgi:predicted transcriptional regulator
VKQLTIVSFLLVFLLLATSVYAQVQYYGIDIVLDEKGRSSVRLTITFEKPETSFKFKILGRIEKFNMTSIAGPVSCSVDVSGISSIACSLSLTTEKRTIDIVFETGDFVKVLGNKFYFDVDLSLNKNIDQVFVSLRLPEGMALSNETIPGRLSYPENTTTISDGRHIIIIWKLTGVKSDQSIRLQALYEQLQMPLPFQLRLRYIAVFGVAVAGVLAFTYIRYFRKPEKLILSVLDEFERKVINVIVATEGVVNQKKVVQETNLSKAKISRVVKSLVERGLIEVERVGRTNKLKLVKKKFRL